MDQQLDETTLILRENTGKTHGLMVKKCKEKPHKGTLMSRAYREEVEGSIYRWNKKWNKIKTERIEETTY